MYFHYATGSKNYEIPLFGFKRLATTVHNRMDLNQSGLSIFQINIKLIELFQPGNLRATTT